MPVRGGCGGERCAQVRPPCYIQDFALLLQGGHGLFVLLVTVVVIFPYPPEARVDQAALPRPDYEGNSLFLMPIHMAIVVAAC